MVQNDSEDPQLPDVDPTLYALQMSQGVQMDRRFGRDILSGAVNQTTNVDNIIQKSDIFPALEIFQHSTQQGQNSGACGYFQGLLQSVACAPHFVLPPMHKQYDCALEHMNNDDEQHKNEDIAYKYAEDAVEGNKYAPTRLEVDNCVQDAVEGITNSPTRIDVDESGYASSGSSLYDIYSDDEFYGNDTICAQDEECNILEENLVDDCPADDNSSPSEQESGTPRNHNACSSGEAVEDCPCLGGNPFFHVLTEVRSDTEGTWKKRNRNKKGQKREDCRVPKGMGPIEIALRNAPFRKTKHIFEPLLGITFDSEDEAYAFYNMYSWEFGFGIKYDSIASNRTTKFQTGRDLRCLCSGTPTACEYNSKKTGCKAMIRLLRTEDDGWYISCHVEEHNHPLTVSCGEKMEWFSHKKLDPNAKEMIRYLRENNVSLTKVHCIMGSMYGSMEKVPFTKRSLRSICQRIAKDQMDDDIHKTLNAFREIRSKDPGFQFSVLPDEKNQIKALMWINGRSRDQYKYFGDVITFDTTYSTNIYKMPFGLFVGVNNHFQTTIFGGVFMKDETIPSFEWVFSEFVSLMGGKVPNTVFTDQCASMAAALREVWKGATHLLCKWHVFKDAPAKLGPIYKKGSPFRKLFHKIINDMLTVDEFERAWDYMLDHFKLRKNKYLSDLYNKREKWAKAYFRDKFCARMSSTQRSESANHMLKRFVPRNCSMNRFILQFNKLLFDRNREEDRAEYQTKLFNNVRKRAWPIEEHAATFYTAAVHALLRKEIDKSTNYFAVEKIEKKEFEVVHVKPHCKLPWGREKLIVLVNNGGKSYECECGLYQHFGVLCSHVLRVMIQLGVYEIPKAHINKRWTRSARDMLPGELKAYQQDTLCMESMTYRHTYLYVNAMECVDSGNKDLGAFEIVAPLLKEIQRKLKEYYKSKEKLPIRGAADAVVMQNNYYTTESDVGIDSGSETETGFFNSYGAAGSSARMSDSELLKIRAPSFNRPPGRPRQNRMKGALDYFDTKQELKNKHLTHEAPDGKKNKRRKIRCSKCEILGHSSQGCKKKHVDASSVIPEF